MNLAPTDEQETFRQSLRRFVETTSTSLDARRLIESKRGFDEAVWRRMADELGLLGLLVSSEAGGSGSGWTEMVIVLEELGRQLVSAPFLSTAVLTPALLADVDDQAARDLLAAATAGQAIVAVVLPSPWGDAPRGVSARLVDSGWLVDGEAACVIDGATADVVLVVADTRDGPRLFAIDSTAAQSSPLETLDLTRRQASLIFTSSPGTPLGDPSSYSAGHSWYLAAVAISAEQLGGAARCLEISVEHAQNRHQFGRPVGSFQAVKHMCADMLVDVEAARSAVRYAAWAADHDRDRLAEAASLAKVVASEAFTRVAGRMIQVHGGIGFTWEHDAHLYYRRAHSTNLLFGTPAEHRAELATGALGLGA